MEARMEQGQPHTKERPSSRMLEDLLHQAPSECFTLGWLVFADTPRDASVRLGDFSIVRETMAY
jgi:hypothetical protein